jgi:hypothetical protein
MEQLYYAFTLSMHYILYKYKEKNSKWILKLDKEDHSKSPND